MYILPLRYKKKKKGHPLCINLQTKEHRNQPILLNGKELKDYYKRPYHKTEATTKVTNKDNVEGKIANNISRASREKMQSTAQGSMQLTIQNQEFHFQMDSYSK